MDSVENDGGEKARGRVAVIGLDGATFNLLDPFMRDGLMPRLKGICDTGRRAILMSTKPPITACAWPSMYTGAEPGRHSIFDFRRPLRNPDLRRRFINSSSIRLPKLWEIIAEDGGCSILLNLPLTYPPFDMHGRLISGMPLPADAREITHPRGLLDEIERECGGYVADIDFLRGEIPDIEDDEAVEGLLAQLRRALQLRLCAALHLMATIEWRLFFPCFILPDRVQHLYYTLLDEKCLEGRPLNNAEDKLRARLTGLYADLDNAIGKIADSLNEDDTLIFVSDHGFGPLKRIFHLNTWLRDRGYLKFKADDVRSWLGRILPESVKRPLRAVVGRRKAGASGAGVLAMVDWDATRAYCGSGAEQGVYINLKGREPFGVVEQGMEYIKVRDALMRELAEAIDPATHEKVFEVVLPREEVQSGRYIEDAADIFIQPRRHEWIMAEEHVEDLSIPWHHQWGGFHREEGIFIASGPSINAGESLPPFDMTQVMPSILAMLALPIPEWVDAAPPGGLFSDEFTSAHPLKRKAYAELLAKYEKDAPTDADDTGGEDLLKGLGYIN